MNGQNMQPDEELTTQDIVSAGRRRDDVKPDASSARAVKVDTPSTTPMPLLATGAADALQARWDAIQTAFVDEPRQVVQQADGLVADVMRQLAETFARERANLEQQWDRGGDVSTEDLRLALQRYRSFFQRLLSA